jgi:hypothetical protein
MTPPAHIAIVDTAAKDCSMNVKSAPGNAGLLPFQ